MWPDIDEITVIKSESDTSPDTPWQVILFDDPVNLMSFVTMVLRRIFSYSEAEAEALMLEVHSKGRSVVWTGEREKAEFYVQQLHSYQLNAAMEKN